MGRRSQVDLRLAEELANGRPLAKAAEAAGCSTRTAERRYAEPAFRDLVRELWEQGHRERQAKLHETWNLGVGLLRNAMLALGETLGSPTASHADKARAARILMRAFGPREEPPAPKIPSVEEEQQAAAAAEEIRRLLQGNVVDMAARRPPVAGQPSWPPPPPTRPPAAHGVQPVHAIPEDDEEDPDDPEDPEPAEIRPAATVGQEYGKKPPPQPGGAPEPELVPIDPAAEARRYLRENPRRPPVGPELMMWLAARKAAGLDPPAEPVRRRRRRGR